MWKLFELLSVITCPSFVRSIAELLTEPSPLAKLYVVIALSTFVGKEDLQLLIESLPPECDFVKKPGLIHLLPERAVKFIEPPPEVASSELAQSHNIFENISLPIVADIPVTSFEDSLMHIAKSHISRLA